MTSLMVSFSLAFGILVSDLRGYRVLTSAHAQSNSCSGTPVATRHARVSYGLVLGGIHFRTIRVDGHVITHGVIASDVRIEDTTIVGANGLIDGGGGVSVNGALVGDGSPVATNGALVGDNSPCTNGALVGDGSPAATNGALVGDGSPVATNGALVGDGSPAPTSAILSDGVAVNGV